ncbi:MAG TPA: transglutaminase-like domain-containing protein [Clostridiales bacterium]|nr:transglutaminase-like domain-containing protein [Clostridiales bacterium]
MKKFFLIFISLLLILSLAACDADQIIGKIRDFNLVEFVNNRTDWDSMADPEESELGSPYKYYFKLLSNKEKYAYNKILENLEGMPEEIPVPLLSQDELLTMYEALLYDNPELFFLGRKCTITTKGTKSYFNPEYLMSAEEYEQKRQELDTVKENILKDMPRGDDFETELFVHDTVIGLCSYSSTGNENENTVYGALVEGKAACEGYSKSAKMFLDLAGVESQVLTGNAKNAQGGYEPHMWNIVKIDGDYYHLDLTWDDPVTVGKDEDYDPIHAYFNLKDSEIAATHEDFSSLNACIANEANFFVRKGLMFDSYDKASKQKIVNLIVRTADANRISFEIRFSNKETFEKAIEKMIKESEISYLLYDARKLSSNPIPYNPTYRLREEFCIFELLLS